MIVALWVFQELLGKGLVAHGSDFEESLTHAEEPLIA